MNLATPVSSRLPWYMPQAGMKPTVLAGCPADLRPLVDFFLTNGYVVIKKSVSSDVCDSVLGEFRRFERDNREIFSKHLDQDGHYPRIINLHCALPALIRLFADNPLGLRLQDYLFQGETALYTSLFYERGSAQPVHRDTPYFCTRPEYRYFGMWVALEDVDAGNGPLAVIPGGHLLPELDRPAVALRLFSNLDEVPAESNALWTAYQNEVHAGIEAAGLTVTEVQVQKGDTILWHPQLPHGGAPIRDIRRTRFSLVMHTTPVGTPVYHQDVFFNPDKDFPTTAPWSYTMFHDRRYANHDSVSFGHVVDYKLGQFAKSGI